MHFVTLVDDHALLRQGLAQLINTFPDFKVLFEADNGKAFIKKLEPNKLPEIVLMDITMPEMNGFETTKWLKINHPSVKVIALSMMDDEEAIIKMLQSGAKGYLLKNESPTELENAMREVISKGYHFNELVSNKVISNLNAGQVPEGNTIAITERELQFLKLACTEKSYKEIADALFLSPRTIEKFRDNLFEKFDVNTRLGLVLAAVKLKLVAL